MSEPKVNPQDWRTCPKIALRAKWYIQYRFYDPNFREKYPKGKQIIIKSMNQYATLQERRDATAALIEDIYVLHKADGYNPISKQFYKEPEIEYAIHPNTLLPKALKQAMDRLSVEKRTLTDVKNSLTHIVKSIKALNYDYMPVSKVTRKHIRLILDNCVNVKKYWSNSLFNNYRKYLSMIFNELLELEAIEHHPVRDISKKKTVQKIRQTLTKEERTIVNTHLLKNHYEFWRYTQIFFHSGRRSSELLSVKREHVDLHNQRYKIVDKKGKKYIEKWAPIKTIALPLWEEIMTLAKPNQYLFAYDLKPGDKPIKPDQITKRWRRNVKAPLGITADFYSLKHSNADDIAAMYSLSMAQGFIGHSSEKMTRVYATGQNERDIESMKGIENVFG